MAKLTVTTNQNKPVVIDDTSADPKQWVTFSDNTNGINVRLYEASKSNIYNSKGWLTDSGIHAAQQLLKIQFPHIDGLNDSDIIKADLVTPAISEFTQIVNTGMNWICLLVVEVTVSNQKVQQQKGNSDCGFFAIAFATTLCFGRDPVEMKYDQPLLRVHYIKCLESLKMTPFPTPDKRVPMLKSVSKAVGPIYCTCKTPDDGEHYMECYMYHEWFHPECVKGPA
ncbi:hypothetical protein AWC38_SpisGene18817 [Stylophora pistillata]|uniref:Ubiquitin-like protease family profile domain-containing protein n=1 Tax=Stylophora pistillata TaxID=50429 RepID=A0A2B4RK58_STYPI|nr:hypothetical protein AWC38_SpisGene18817 [Stylophora pistillata]